MLRYLLSYQRLIVALQVACVLTIPVLSGCGGKSQTFGPSPDWANGKASNNLFYYGVGGPSPTMEDAKKSARNELAKTIEVQIDVEIVRIARAENEDVNRVFIDRSRTYATQKLPDVQITETYIGQNGNYALARLRREVVSQLLEEAVGQSQRDVLNREQHADEALKSGNVISALREYEAALRVARTLPSHYNHPPDNPEALWTTEIERKRNRIDDGIQIEATAGNEQTGAYGEALTEPLMVQVRYENDDGRVPLKAFPLQAAYTRGAGRLKNVAGETGQSVRLVTDETGKAACWIDAIASISRENRVRISADTEAVQLPLQSKSVTFRYASHFPAPHSPDTPTVTLNGSADEQEFVEGDKVTVEVRLPRSGYAHLLSILADGHFSYQQAIPISREYQGTGWRILRGNPGWTLQIEEVPVTAERGVGMETLLVITTEKEWKPVGGTLTADGLRRQLNESVGPGNWHAGWVSYYVKRANGN